MSRFAHEITAKGVARSSDAAMRVAQQLQVGAAPPCPYEAHRWSDWRRTDGGPRVCGICHPPATSIPPELREAC